MKCPLLQRYLIQGEDAALEVFDDCLREECAWWYVSTDYAGNNTSRCAVQCMAEGLATAISAQGERGEP
uniref:Uncharacterized protein n=1 Tax=viral metagenome TaxID=1070528 RepID=A0A6H2A1N5_9ZZZZ